MSKQKTAVYFYDQQLHILDLRLKSGSITIGEYLTLKAKLYIQAKQMEKEQIIDAFDKGLITENVYHGYDDKKAEQYYESNYE